MLASLPAAGAAAPCPPPRLAELPVRSVLGFPVVRAAIDGVPVSLLLDTGAEAGLLTPEAATALRLPPDPERRTLIQGTGGDGTTAPNVVVPRLSLGGMDVIGSSLPVAPLPAAPRVQPPVAGLLGADLLAGLEAELDLRRGVLALYPALPACAGVPPWPHAQAVPLRRLGTRMAVEVELDGRTLLALVDSGARATIVSDEAAMRLGVSRAALDRDPGGVTGGVDMRDTPFHWHRFRSLRIGSETDRNPTLTVTRLHDQAEALLGTDWLGRHRVWLSPASGRMYVAP